MTEEDKQNKLREVRWKVVTMVDMDINGKKGNT